MTLAFAALLLAFSQGGPALPLARASPLSQGALLPASDSLTISGVVRSPVGLRQPHARVRLARCSRAAGSFSQPARATWTNQDGCFLFRISRMEAADSLLIRATCRARPRSTSYLWGAEKFVDVAQRRPYTIWLKKRRIYPKVR
jgi:hypothetical protein